MLRAKASFLAPLILQMVVSIMAIPVLTRALTQDEYGFVALLITAQQLISVLIALGLPHLVTSFELHGEPLRAQSAGLLVVLLGASLSAATASASLLLAATVVIATLNAVLALALGRLRAERRGAYWAAVTVTAGPLAQAVAVGFSAHFGTASAYVTAWFAVTLAAVAAAAPALRRQWWRPSSIQSLAPLVRTAASMSVVGVMTLVLLSGDRLIVAVVLGEESLARYQAAYAIGNVANSASTALYTYWASQTMRGSRSSQRRYEREVACLAALGALSSGPALMWLLPEAYQPTALWPVAASAAVSALPLARALVVQGRMIHGGHATSVASRYVIVAVVAVSVCFIVAPLGELAVIAAVTPAANLALAAALNAAERKHA